MIFKNIIVTIIVAAGILTPKMLQAKELAGARAVERIYVVTDRTSYLAGESIWVSLFCFDISKEKGTLSKLSSVAYLELINENGLSTTAKIHLNNGRGSGKLSLPPSLPTGNYKLIAYTKQMRNEEVFNYFEKNIPVFNALTTERVQGNVLVSKGALSEVEVLDKFIPSNSNRISLSVDTVIKANNSYTALLNNYGNDKISVTVSICRADNLPSGSNESLSTFLVSRDWNNKDIKFLGNYIPEYEGEIIEGSVNYDKNSMYLQYITFLSAVGKEPNVYSSYVDSTGRLIFFTNSIFGDREIVLEIPSADTNSSSIFELFDGFAKPNTGAFPKLLLTPSYELALNERSIEMQLGRRFGSDTLYERIKVRKDPLLNTLPKVYFLDDYTRFPVMSEVMIEYIPELRFRKIDKMVDLQIRWTDAFNSITFSKGSTLPLIDGIPIFKHQKIYDYDPLKIKSISIYGGEFLMGAAKYDGIVMFNTYKNDFVGLKFSNNAKIIDFQGVQYPSKFTANKVIDKDNLPDLRSLLYWDPQVDILSNGNSKFMFHTSGLSGKFLIKIEGVTENGESIYYSKIVQVK